MSPTCRVLDFILNKDDKVQAMNNPKYDIPLSKSCRTIGISLLHMNLTCRSLNKENEINDTKNVNFLSKYIICYDTWISCTHK
jgi:hypothetical protein